MEYVISQITKYIILICSLSYSFMCFYAYIHKPDEKRDRIYTCQLIIRILIHFFAGFTLFIVFKDSYYITSFLIQEALFCIYYYLSIRLFPRIDRLILNNMLMLITIGLIIIGRLSKTKSQRQFYIIAGALALSFVVIFLITKIVHLEKFKYIFAAIGIFSLLTVLLFSNSVYGSKINFTIANYTFAPSEYVKIIFVFCIATLLYNEPDLRQIIISAVIAGIHVILLVFSKDLGSAVIFFVIYFAMLYVATKKIIYYLAGFLAGAGASIIGYKLFSHVRVRIVAYLDPFGNIDGSGYQIAQSLFAIGTGGWFGMGLGQGAPNTIPVVAADFIFSALVEELGLLFGFCLIMICVSCFVMFMNIAMRFSNMIYKLIAVGLAVSYGFQVLLTIGGVTKFIPLTGVTLPLVSYGGTSIVVTVTLFALIQGFYISKFELNHLKPKDSGINNLKTDNKRFSGSKLQRSEDYQPKPKQNIKPVNQINSNTSHNNTDIIDKNLSDTESVINYIDKSDNNMSSDEEDIIFRKAVEEGLKLIENDPNDYLIGDIDDFSE